MEKSIRTITNRKNILPIFLYTTAINNENSKRFTYVVFILTQQSRWNSHKSNTRTYSKLKPTTCTTCLLTTCDHCWRCWRRCWQKFSRQRMSVVDLIRGYSDAHHILLLQTSKMFYSFHKRLPLPLIVRVAFFIIWNR